MPDYTKSKAYALLSDNLPGTCYVGTTTQKYLSSRKAQHKADYLSYLKGEHHYVTSFEVIKFPDARIVLLQECPCEYVEQLQAIERKYIESMTCVNKNIPGRTRHEYYADNKETLEQNSKQWKKMNPEKVKASNKKYKQNPKNKEKQRIQQKAKYEAADVEARGAYYQKNKERIAKKNSEIVTCELCNCDVTRGNLTKHQHHKNCVNNRPK
jgi:hypothetical protein